MLVVVPAQSLRRRAWLTLLLLAICLPASARPQPQGRPQRPAPLELSNAMPQEAFGRLGERHGVRFSLVEPEEWIGGPTGATVNAALRNESLWEAVLIFSEQTGYEPVFRPYGRDDDGTPIIWLRRVDVAAEEGRRPAKAAGPVLVRPAEAFIGLPLRMAQLRMVPMQAWLRTEVMVDPTQPAVYVTAAALRASDEEGAEFRRTEGHDPTVALDGGVGELMLRFDILHRMPAAVGQWRALLRIVSGERYETVIADVTTIPEEHANLPMPATLPATVPAVGGADDEQPATAPTTLPIMPVTSHALGPYRFDLEPVRIGEREARPATARSDAEPAKRVATVRMIVPRADLDHTEWGRLYGFLLSLPPELGVGEAGEAGGPWRRTGYAVVSIASAEDPEVAGSFRVWARYEAPAGSPDPEWLGWSLPAGSREARELVSFQEPVPIRGVGFQELLEDGRGDRRPAGR